MNTSIPSNDTVQEMTKLFRNKRVGIWLGESQVVAQIFIFFACGLLNHSKNIQHPATALLVSLTLLALKSDTAADSKAQLHPGLPHA